MSRSDLAPGLLLLILGLFVILRTVTKDDTHRTLIDRILGNNKPVAVASQSAPVPAATTKWSLRQSQKIPAGKK